MCETAPDLAPRVESKALAGVGRREARNAQTRQRQCASAELHKAPLTALRFAADDPASVNPAALRALLDAGVRVVTLSAEERSLEDAYLSILAEARR